MNGISKFTGFAAIFLGLGLLFSPSLAVAQNNSERTNSQIPNENIERVILISIDAMGTMLEDDQNENFTLTPNIKKLKNKGVYFRHAKTVLPAATQVNHLTMVTGAYPEIFDIPGNLLYDEEKNKIIHPWEHPEVIKGETIFQAMEKQNPAYNTAVLGGKNYVGRPIEADFQIAPSRISKNTKENFPNFHLFPEPYCQKVWVVKSFSSF